MTIINPTSYQLKIISQKYGFHYLSSKIIKAMLQIMRTHVGLQIGRKKLLSLEARIHLIYT